MGKKKPGAMERAILDEIDDAEREIADELLKDFGVIDEAEIMRRPSPFSSDKNPDEDRSEKRQ